MANLNENVVNSTKNQRLLRKYDSKLKLAESAIAKRGLEMNYERKLATAICLENTSTAVKLTEGASMGGATQPANIGQYKRYSIRVS